MIQEKKVYETSDGKHFEDRTMAEMYEASYQWDLKGFKYAEKITKIIFEPNTNDITSINDDRENMLEFIKLQNIVQKILKKYPLIKNLLKEFEGS